MGIITPRRFLETLRDSCLSSRNQTQTYFEGLLKYRAVCLPSIGSEVDGQIVCRPLRWWRFVAFLTVINIKKKTWQERIN